MALAVVLFFSPVGVLEQHGTGTTDAAQPIEIRLLWRHGLANKAQDRWLWRCVLVFHRRGRSTNWGGSNEVFVLPDAYTRQHPPHF